MRPWIRLRSKASSRVRNFFAPFIIFTTEGFSIGADAARKRCTSPFMGRVFGPCFVRTSIAQPGERGALVEGDMLGLAALDLVLRIVRARMVGVAVDLELAGMHADDRAADATGLGIPAHAIVNLEAFRHGGSIRCLTLNAFNLAV